VDTADEVFRNTVWEPGVTGYGLQVGNVSVIIITYVSILYTFLKITIYCSEGGASFNYPTSPNSDKWTAQTLLKVSKYSVDKNIVHLLVISACQIDLKDITYQYMP